MVEEREVNIRNLFWGIISKWKIIIIVVIIGALIGGGYSYLKSGSMGGGSTEVSGTDLGNATVESLINQAKGLSLDDGVLYLQSLLSDSDVNSITVYDEYKELYDYQKKHMDSMQAMQYDPFNTYQGQYLYYIKASASELDSILAAYKSRLNNLREIYGGNLFSYFTESYATSLVNNTTVSEVEISPSGTMGITVYATSKEECSKWLQEIDDYLSKSFATINNSVGSHEINKVSESLFKVQDTFVLDSQRSQVDILNNLNSNTSNIFKGLSVQAQAFIKYTDDYLESDRSMLQSRNNSLNSSNLNEPRVSEDVTTINKKSISPKWVAVGAIIGFAIVVIILAIIYCVSNKMRYEDNIEMALNVPCLGLTRLKSGKRRIGIDRLIEKSRYKRISILSDDCSAQLVAANISVCANDKNVKVLYASGTFFNEDDKNYAEDVKKHLVNKGIDLVIGARLFSDASEIEKMGDAGYIVLFENESKSDYNEVAKSIKACADLGVKTLGLILCSKVK